VLAAAPNNLITTFQRLKTAYPDVPDADIENRARRACLAVNANAPNICADPEQPEQRVRESGERQPVVPGGYGATAQLWIGLEFLWYRFGISPSAYSSFTYIAL
jgi:hypothetical protein